MARRKSATERRTALALDAVDAYRRHRGRTTQREDAAANLGMDLPTFRAALDDARRLGFDIEAPPEQSSS
ncbi:hypothetical protein SAMN05660199_00079 [Klenkia soli]|uniref:Uncharacterized protein n=1 Tax=Klenkia soli TaxID=1052260 RepID=A0A1H0BPI2_9ACTN|nr:hypothetical protein [Klenkia soli]SDN47569.1 hypothetical protein SAMN05660199_00079 [Klenkia soli]